MKDLSRGGACPASGGWRLQTGVKNLRCLCRPQVHDDELEVIVFVRCQERVRTSAGTATAGVVWLSRSYGALADRPGTNDSRPNSSRLPRTIFVLSDLDMFVQGGPCGVSAFKRFLRTADSRTGTKASGPCALSCSVLCSSLRHRRSPRSPSRCRYSTSKTSECIVSLRLLLYHVQPS